MDSKAINYLIQTCNASISLLASLTIMLMIFLSTKRLSTPYRRLIFGMSAGDVILSGALVTGPFAIPSGSITASWSSGNVASCDANGFFMVLGSMAVPLYTFALSLHYFCKLNLKMSAECFYTKIERKLYFAMVFFLAATVFTGLGLNAYGQIPYGSFCYFSENRCGSGSVGDGNYYDDVNSVDGAAQGCVNGKGFEPLIYAYVSVIFFCFAGIITNMTMLCTKSCYIERAFRSQAGDPQNFSDYSCINHYLSCVPCRNHEQLAHEADADYVLRLYKRETIIQSCLYVGAFFTSHFCPILGIISSRNSAAADVDNIDFDIQWITSFLYPLGGFFNILVYTRPKVVRLLYLYPDLSRLTALRLVIQAGGEMPDVPLHPSVFGCCGFVDSIGNDGLFDSEEPNSSHAFQVRMMLRDFSD